MPLLAELQERELSSRVGSRSSESLGAPVNASQIDAAILVVVASEGAIQQSREHVVLARQVGVPHIVVALTKADGTDDPEIVAAVEL